MRHQIRFAEPARRDIERLYRYLPDQDLRAADAAMQALEKAWDLLRDFPFSARKADPANSLLREFIIPFAGAGYVALYEIEDQHTVTVLAVRHQREEDYH